MYTLSVSLQDETGRMVRPLFVKKLEEEVAKKVFDRLTGCGQFIGSWLEDEIDEIADEDA